MDCSSPGSSVHGILQIRKLEWVAIPSSGRSSQPKDWTCISCIGRQVDSLPLSHLQSPLGARPYPKQFPHIISFRLLNNQLLSHLSIPMHFLIRKTNSVIRYRSFYDFSGGKKPPIKEHFGKPLEDFRNDHRYRTESIAIKARSCGKYWQDYIKHFYRVLFQIQKGGATSVRSFDDDDLFYTNFFLQLRLAQVLRFSLNCQRTFPVIFLRLLPLLLCFQLIFFHRTNWEIIPNPILNVILLFQRVALLTGWEWRASEWRSRPPSTCLVFSPFISFCSLPIPVYRSILRKYLHCREE